MVNESENTLTSIKTKNHLLSDKIAREEELLLKNIPQQQELNVKDLVENARKIALFSDQITFLLSHSNLESDEKYRIVRRFSHNYEIILTHNYTTNTILWLDSAIKNELKKHVPEDYLNIYLDKYNSLCDNIDSFSFTAGPKR